MYVRARSKYVDPAVGAKILIFNLNELSLKCRETGRMRALSPSP